MKALLAVTKGTSNVMSVIAGFILLIMMTLTFLDIVMRFFGKPIVGAYELVAFMGVAVAAFALPRASLLKTHVYVDLVIDKLPRSAQKILRVFTRIAVFFMFSFAAWYFVLMAKNFIASKTVTMSLRVPFYPVVFALAAGSIVQCLISICEIFSERGGAGE
jgi:TRAP-type C4-dicarboxylate transport system permease small subunit